MADPLLLLPGLMCDARLWGPVQERLWALVPERDRYAGAHVAALRGARSAPDLAARLLRHAPPRFALAGAALGAMVALEMVAQAPERITRLTLLAGDARPDALEKAPARFRLLEAMEREGARTMVAREFWPDAVPAARREDAALFDLLCDMADTLGPAVLREQTAVLIHRADSRPRLAAIQVPVLLISGEEDRLCPPARMQEIAETVPGARAMLLPGVGHLPSLEAPEAVAAGFAEWLAA